MITAPGEPITTPAPPMKITPLRDAGHEATLVALGEELETLEVKIAHHHGWRVAIVIAHSPAAEFVLGAL